MTSFLETWASNETNSFGWGVKLYPSGEFCLYRKKKDETTKRFKEAFVSAGAGKFRGHTFEEVQQMYGTETAERWWKEAAQVDLSLLRRGKASATGVVLDMGLAAPSNSKKARRGLRGLTSHGKNMVREAAYALQRTYGKDRLSFWTCTLPRMSIEDTRTVCENWGAIMNNLRLKLTYHLKKAGLPLHIVGVTELQPERFKKENYPCWHIHWVFVGKMSSGTWLLDTDLTDKLWKDAVETWCESSYDFRLSCRLERIRKSAGGYLAKYMSKGSQSVSEVEKDWAGCSPSSWYTCTKGVKNWVKSCTRKSESVARWIHQRLLDEWTSIVAPWAFQLELRPGVRAVVCWLGRIPDPPNPAIRLADA